MSEWQAEQIIETMLNKKLENLNKRDALNTNSKGNVNQKRREVDPVEKINIGKECLTLCIACYEAGKGPRECLFFGVSGLRCHRRKNTCIDPLFCEPRSEKGTGINIEKVAKSSAANTDGVHYIKFRIPGVYTTVEFKPNCKKYNRKAIIKRRKKFPGWKITHPAVDFCKRYLIDDMHSFFRRLIDHRPHKPVSLKDIENAYDEEYSYYLREKHDNDVHRTEVIQQGKQASTETSTQTQEFPVLTQDKGTQMQSNGISPPGHNTHLDFTSPHLPPSPSLLHKRDREEGHELCDPTRPQKKNARDGTTMENNISSTDTSHCTTIGTDICTTIGTDICTTIGTDICTTIASDICTTIARDICTNLNTRLSDSINTNPSLNSAITEKESGTSINTNPSLNSAITEKESGISINTNPSPNCAVTEKESGTSINTNPSPNCAITEKESGTNCSSVETSFTICSSPENTGIIPQNECTPSDIFDCAKNTVDVAKLMMYAMENQKELLDKLFELAKANGAFNGGSS